MADSLFRPDFFPPHLSPPLVRLLQGIADWGGQSLYRMQLQIGPGGLERLRALESHRLVLLPNHPTYHDWIALFMLSARWGECLHYLAAYERFQGWQGPWLQRLGAYSIRRGLGDRPSVAQTLEVLRQPRCRLVIFPEGGCSFQNDTVMPFRAGAIQIPLQALHRLAKQGGEIPDLYLLPISIKYRYRGQMGKVVDQTLGRLERGLKLPTQDTPQDAYDRLRRVGARVLCRIEQEYGIPATAEGGADWNPRIERLRTELLNRCECQLGLSPRPEQWVRERVYRVQRVLEERAEDWLPDRLYVYESIHRTAARLLNFDAIYDGYVASDPTPERFLDTLTRLEREVFQINQPQPKGDRTVLIQIGEPVNLKDHYEAFQRQRESTIEELRQGLWQQVQRGLDGLSMLDRSVVPVRG